MGEMKPYKLTCDICNKPNVKYSDDDGDGMWHFCSKKCWNNRFSNKGWGAIC